MSSRNGNFSCNVNISYMICVLPSIGFYIILYVNIFFLAILLFHEPVSYAVATHEITTYPDILSHTSPKVCTRMPWCIQCSLLLSIIYSY